MNWSWLLLALPILAGLLYRWRRRRSLDVEPTLVEQLQAIGWPVKRDDEWKVRT